MADSKDYRQRAAETKRDRTRKALLMAARQLLEEVSWDDIRFDDIAERARVSPATAYQYFKNKRAIVGPALEPFFIDMRTRLESDMEQMPALQALEKLVHNLSSFTRKKQTLTANLLAATREQAIRGEGRLGEEPDILEFVPFSSLMIGCLKGAQDAGEICTSLRVDQIGNYHVNALFLRIFVDREETAEDTANLVLSQIRPVLAQLSE